VRPIHRLPRCDGGDSGSDGGYGCNCNSDHNGYIHVLMLAVSPDSRCKKPSLRTVEAVDVSVDIGEELVERIAVRAAELVARQRVETTRGGWLRGADKIAAYIDAPRSRVYGLVSARRIPVHHDGSALIARRSELDAWLLNGGGRRT
jgi:hypothetical protein